MTPLLWRMTPHAYAWRPGAGAGSDGTEPAAFLLKGMDDAAMAGYTGIEASLVWFAGADGTQAVRQSLKARGLVLDALFVQVATGISQDAIEELIGMAVLALPVGFRFLNVVTVPRKRQNDGLTWDGEPEIVARITGALARALHPSGVTVCWHPHDASLRASGTLARRVLDLASAPVGLCLDLGWVLRASEDPARMLDEFGDVVRTLHVRDMAADGQWCEAVGEGCLDLAVLRERLRGGSIGACAVELMYERGTRVTRSLRDNARISADALTGAGPRVAG